MDILLPDISGFESAKLIFALNPNAHIVFVSSLAYDDTVEQVNKMGNCSLIYKPFSREELLACLRKAAGALPALSEQERDE